MELKRVSSKVKFVYVLCWLLILTCSCVVDGSHVDSLTDEQENCFCERKECPFWVSNKECITKSCEDGIGAVSGKSIVHSEINEFNVSPTHIVNNTFETITFGMGCFWGAESLFGATKGVLRTTVGYTGGTTENPRYRNLSDHTEVLELDYDPSIVSFEELLQLFWNNHEYGLSGHKKRQYMSVIFYHNDNQRQVAEKSRSEEKIKRKPEVIATEINKATTFYPAEDYHQKYRLQEHKELMKSLNINSTHLLRNSYVAAKLNGYLVGVRSLREFLDEVDEFGLTPTQKEYVKHYVEKNQGRGLFC